MELRPDPIDEYSNIVVYESETEAEFVITHSNILKKTLAYLGLTEIEEVSNRNGLELLDSGEVQGKESTGHLQKLAHKFGRFSINKLTATPDSWAQDEVDQSSALTKGLYDYLANRRPVQFNVLKREFPEVPQVKYVKSAVDKAKRSKIDELMESQYEKLRRRVFYGLGASAVSTVIGSVFYVAKNYYIGNQPAADRVFTPDFLHHTNDFVNAAPVIAGATVIYTIQRFLRMFKDENLYKKGWDDGTARLDPDGFIEAALSRTDNTEAEHPAELSEEVSPT